MTRAYWPLLLLLAAVWGASYLFIKVAVDEIAPAPMMAVRTLLAAAVLLAYVVWRFGATRARAELRDAWRHCAVLGLLSAAIPFWLIAWGEQHIDSGLAAIVQASVPIFNALFVLRFLPHERLTRLRALGLAIGIVGVGVVTGIHPEGGGLAVAGALAVVLSSVSYAAGGVYGQKAVSATPGPVLAAGSMLAGGLVLTPVALFQLPNAVPSWEATGSVLALSLAGTALAQLVLFRVLALHGSSRLSLVTYLMPAFALAYGTLLLDEELTASTIGGLALILGGVALASGALRLRRREPAAVRVRP
jgi:drug/metabolite transporter (DMT)-like permease